MANETNMDLVLLTRQFIRTHLNSFTPDAAEAMRGFFSVATKADVTMLIEMVTACTTETAAASVEG